MTIAKKMKVMKFFLFLSAVSFLLLSSPSQASLIGDEITASVDINEDFLEPSIATVHESDIEFTYNNPFTYFFDFDFNVDTLSIRGVGYMLAPFTMSEVFNFSQFDETLENVSIISNEIIWGGLIETDIIGEHEFSLSFSDVEFHAGPSEFQVQILTREQTSPVPEPDNMLFLGTGLAGLAVFGRKKFFKK